MKIALILPYDSVYRYKRGTFTKAMLYPPLTLTTLAALVPQELGAEIELYDEGSRLIDLDCDAEIIGISAVTATAKRAFELADHFRSRGKTVILGGAHPTVFPDESLKHADCVIVGCADVSWPKALLDYKNGSLKKLYDEQPDLSIKGLPPPRRDLLPSAQYLTVNTVMASRGCPNKCSFCSIPVICKGRYYQRPVEEVMEDIKTMKGDNIIFFDPSFTEDKDYSMKLMEKMRPLNKRWCGLSTISVCNDEKLLGAASESGCIGVLIGFETLCQSSLYNMEKHFNRVEQYEKSVKTLHKHNMAVLACMMFGLDNDTPEVFDKTLEFVRKTRIDLMRYTIFTPFPGTAAFAKLEKEGRIISRNWDLYDYEHVVFKPLNMTVEQLRMGLARVWRETYRIRKIVNRAVFDRRYVWLTLPASLAFRKHGIALERQLKTDAD